MTRFRSIDKSPHGQRGNILILFAMLLPVLCGFAALAVDLARLYLIKIELQNAAEAAALAGACVYTVPADFSNAQTEALALAHANGVSSPTITAVAVTGYANAIQVTTDVVSLKFFFAPIVVLLSGPYTTGIDSSNVSATAIAAQTTPGHSILVQ